MNPRFFGALAVILINSVVGFDPTLEFKFKKFTADTEDNPYFDVPTSQISSSGDTISFGVSVKEPWPESTEVVTVIESNGIQVFEITNNLCELMETETYASIVKNHGLPVGKFPKRCPSAPGLYEVSKYFYSAEAFPPGIPSGDYDIHVYIGEPEEEPWVKLYELLEVSHSLIGVPIPIIGR